MEEETTNIIKVITTIDDDKRTYSIDIDDSSTFYEFKKILSESAHLIENNFHIYHKEQEYTNEYDDNTLKEIFPRMQIVKLILKINKNLNEIEEKLLSVKINIKIPCEKHSRKYKVLYCFTCNKSICFDCYILTQEHLNHKIEEKSDYIAPAEFLMNKIFKNSYIFKADTKLSKYIESVNFRADLKLNIFENLRKLINSIENKFNSCLQFFSFNEDLSEKNTNNNIDLIKKYCIEYFIKLKNDIEINQIIIDDKIFLTLYQKLKEVEKYKDEYLLSNKKKYEKLNSLLLPFTTKIENITNELKNNFEEILNQDIYENFSNLVQENTVELIQKNEISDLMFKNIYVKRKSHFHLLNSKKEKERSNSALNKIFHFNKEKNPFKKAISSSPKKEIYSESLTDLKNDNKNDNNNQFSFSQQKIENIGSKKDSLIKVGNRLEINDENCNFENNTINYINNFDINNNNVVNILPVKIIGFVIHRNKSNVIDTNKILNEKYDNINEQNNSLINNIFKKEKHFHENEINKNIGVEQDFQNRNFKENLLEKFNIEANKNLQEIPNNNYNEKELKTEDDIFRDNGKIINQMVKNETTGNTENNNIILIKKINQNHIKIEPNSNPLFLFMYPIFNSNKILGAFKDERTQKLEVDFKQAFNKGDIQLTEFTQGGAYCNSGKYLYVTGGQEMQKGIGKIFLRLKVNEYDKKVKMVKMPMMNYSHWNHSMISNDNYIFVIGGYNSNICECFNLKTLKWEKMFDLNSKERQRAMLVIYKDYLYTFMGYSQFEILDSVERINIGSNLLVNKWENLNISNDYNLNIKFFGSGIYIYGDEAYFIGGKFCHRNDKYEYKTEIYNFSFNKMGFNNSRICFDGKLNFIENKFHLCSDDTFGNFICLNNGCLATISISLLSK